MNTNSRGYAIIVTCLLLPVVLLGLGLITFSLLKTRHTGEMQTVCRQQYYNYFSGLKGQLAIIGTFKETAITLYQTQMALLPLIWLPPALKLYQAILKIRKYLDLAQNKIITLFNSFNKINSIKTFAQIQRALYSENKKIKNTLEHNSIASYTTNSDLQIVKTRNILFPPYQPHPLITQRQQFSVFIRSTIQPKSWIQSFSIAQLTEKFSCSATLLNAPNQEIKISYNL